MSRVRSSRHGGPDPLVDALAGLGGAPPEVLARAVVAVAVVHQPDPRGRCRACDPWWRLRPAGGTCPTRELLRAAVRDATVPRWHPA